MIEYFVHYTVTLPGNKKRDYVAGPYTADEVLEHEQDIKGYAYVSNVYVSEKMRAGA